MTSPLHHRGTRDEALTASHDDDDDEVEVCWITLNTAWLVELRSDLCYIYVCDMCGICICGMCGFRGDSCHDTPPVLKRLS